MCDFSQEYILRYALYLLDFALFEAKASTLKFNMDSQPIHYHAIFLAFRQ